MASAYRELQYRTLDELIDAVRLDLTSFNQTGDIDTAMLIKTAQRINYELGLKIYMARETILEINYGKAKLPADFYQLQLALLCHHYRQISNAPWNGNVWMEEIITPPIVTPVVPNIPTISTCGCWTIINNNVGTPTTFKIVNCDGSDGNVVVAGLTTIKICAISVTDPGIGNHTITQNGFCYTLDGVYSCDVIPTPTTITPCDICQEIHVGTCPIVVNNPFIQGATRSICNGETNIRVLQFGSSTVNCFEEFEKLYIEPKRTASAFCMNNQFRTAERKGSINGNFLEITGNRGYENRDIDREEYFTNQNYCGKVYISYLGGLEDEDGNLLVLDHPVINMYYEYALKQQILENCYINGDADLERRLHKIEEKLAEYKSRALSIANTPDYRNCINVATVTRNMMKRRYQTPIDRWSGYIGFANPIDRII